MSVQLRVVLDQAGQVVDRDTASAARDLAVGLVATAPRGCGVDAIVPAGADAGIRGVDDVRVLALGRRELAAAWQLGFAQGVGGGLVHAPTLMAPLVRHDRVHDHDQTVVTLWDLDAWERPGRLSKGAVAWQRGMLRRAVKHADAIVVPTHAFVERLERIGRFGDRVRVIAGAAPEGFAAPSDAADRRAALSLPSRYLAAAGEPADLEQVFRAGAAADIDVVVVDAADGTEPRIAEIASAAGLPERRVHVRGSLDAADRASLLCGASALVDAAAATAWPWRVLEAMSLGIPVVAVESGAHRDVVADGGRVVAASDLVDAVADAVGEGAARLGVLAGDRSRAFSWASSAERVWALHADL